MKIIISPDSFKGTLTALEAAKSIENGIKQVNKNIETEIIPVADGGEGTLDALISATNGIYYTANVLNPLGKEIKAKYGVLGDGTTCVIEMAQASGITLLHNTELNPRIASSFGTGQLIKDAMDKGYRNFIICIGGSATNDGGVGMLRALGLRLLDESGQEVHKHIDGLLQLASLDFTHWDTRIDEATFSIACDVDNPLIGPSGASAVFGPQKGVAPTEVSHFDHALSHWADIVEREKGIRLHNYVGAGAAGGLGGALFAFLNAQFNHGIELVLNAINFKERIQGAQYVITGEGKSDFQTLHGKAPIGVCHCAKEVNIPTILLSGHIEKHDCEMLSLLFHQVVSVVNDSTTSDMAMESASHFVTQRAYELFTKLID